MKTFHLPGQTYDKVDQHITRYARCATSGLLATFSTTNVSCSASEIAFIDKIVIRGQAYDNGYEIDGLLNGGAVTDVVVAETIDTAYVPASGTITLQRADGTYTEHAYASYTAKTFTLSAATDFSGNNVLDNANCFVNAGNLTLILRMNQRDLPFHLTSTPNAAHVNRLELNPGGNLVLRPGQTLSAKTFDTGQGLTIAIYYRKYPLAKARELGLVSPTMANVASTSIYAMTLGTTLNAAGQTAIVVSGSIPDWMPATGTVRITKDSGAQADIAYTSWTGSTFTIGATDFSGANAATAGVAVVGPIVAGGTGWPIIPALAGHRIQILGFYTTGHFYDADAGSLALGFWNGSGTFYTPPATKAATAWMFCVAHGQGLRSAHHPRIIINNTDGCIEGPVGYAVYAESTSATSDVMTSLVDAVVMYRYVKVDYTNQTSSLATALTLATETAVVLTQPILAGTPATGNLAIKLTSGVTRVVAYSAWDNTTNAPNGTFTISADFSVATGSGPAGVGSSVSYSREEGDTNDFTGALSQTIKRPKKFWVSTIAAPTTLANPVTDATNPWFSTTSVAEDCVIKIKGYAGSFRSENFTAGGGKFAGFADMSLGSVAATALTLGGSAACVGPIAVGAGTFASNSIDEGDILIPTNISLVPGFRCYESTSGDIAARFQVAWGEFTPYRNTTGYNTIIS